MANGKGIKNITVTNSGELYRVAPVVQVSSPTAVHKVAAATATLSGTSITSISIDSEGTYYTSVPAITIGAPAAGGTQAIATAIKTGGRITGVTIADSGSGYTSIPSITIDAPQGGPGNFKASVGVNLNASTETIQSLYLIDSGDFYLTAPTITIAKPLNTSKFIIGEQVTFGAFADGDIMTAEVAAYSDSDMSLSLIHIGSINDNASFHEPVSGEYLTGGTSRAVAKIVTSKEQDKVSDQNAAFSLEIEDLLDFSESNPFGEPARSSAQEH